MKPIYSEGKVRKVYIDYSENIGFVEIPIEADIIDLIFSDAYRYIVYVEHPNPSTKGYRKVLIHSIAEGQNVPYNSKYMVSRVNGFNNSITSYFIEETDVYIKIN
ncbi:hypothetical protein [uncultured Arcobacter sp.]|uniref:hypothetical protein n=1 Tax=uncultured Arcobacter sp. TaxID=165434 RepID=UPI00262ADCB7|nr:hypothetical protein [uncultured Arcobacter sp.]